LLFSQRYREFGPDYDENAEAQWQKASDYVSANHDILNSAAVAPLLFAQQRPIYDSGQSEYFRVSLKQPPPVAFFFVDLARIQKRCDQFHHDIVNKIEDRRFDLLMLDRSYSQWLAPKPEIARNYRHCDVLTLSMPHTGYEWKIDVWEPQKQLPSHSLE